MKNSWIVFGCVSAFLAVALGAFGAHGLRSKVSVEMIAIWNTAAQYQMYHALGMIAFGLWVLFSNGAISSLVGLAFLIGTALFSGSLYALVLTDLKWLGAITPLGGLSFMLGWLTFAWTVFRAK